MRNQSIQVPVNVDSILSQMDTGTMIETIEDEGYVVLRPVEAEGFLEELAEYLLLDKPSQEDKDHADIILDRLAKRLGL